MAEEFHGNGSSATVAATAWKLLYGWGMLGANVWLPASSELVGIDQNAYWSTTGVYKSAMQGLNTSTYYRVDAQGGAQFAYFAQFNQSGGGQAVTNACNQQVSWLRSPGAGHTNLAAVVWTLDTLNFADVANERLAVHPAVLYKEKPGIYLRYPESGWFTPPPAAARALDAGSQT